MASRSTIGKLSVLLTAQTSGFQQAMGRAAKTVRRVGAMAAKAGAAVAAVGAAGLAAAAGGLAALTKQGMALGDELGKNSVRIGITTEALAGLQHAADLAGIKQDQLVKGLQRMNRRLGEASLGMGPAARALGLLGLTAADLAAMAPEDALGAILDGLQGVEGAAKRTALAYDLFGRSGNEMLTLVAGGADNLQASIKEAKLLGLTLTGVQATGIENANDAMTRLRRLMTGLGLQVAALVAPAIQRLADKLLAFGTAGGGVGERVQQAFGWVLNAAMAVGYGLDALREGVLSLKALWLDFAATAIEALEQVGTKTATIAGGVLGALSPGAGAAFQGLANMAGAGLAGTARANADAAAAAARQGLAPSQSWGNAIGQWGAGMFSTTGGPPPTQSDVEQTTEAVEKATSVLARKVDELRNELQQLGTSTVNSQLLRVMDRLVLSVSRGTSAPMPSGAAAHDLGRAVRAL